MWTGTCWMLDPPSLPAWLRVQSEAGVRRVSSLPPRLRSPGSFLSQVLNKASLTERPCYGLGFLGNLVVLGALCLSLVCIPSLVGADWSSVDWGFSFASSSLAYGFLP